MSFDTTVDAKKSSHSALAQEVGRIIASTDVQPFSNEFVVNTTHDHKSGKGIYAVSQRVKKYSEVKDVAERMVAWLNNNNGRFPEPYNTAFAISHCQVADEPLQMFVVSRVFLRDYDPNGGIDSRLRNEKNYFFRSQAIFNAEILEAVDKIEMNIPRREVKQEGSVVKTEVKVEKGTVNNRISMPDACMSFPLKKQKHTERFYRIKVRYQIKGLFGLKTITEYVEGLKAHIFQHEIDHANAINIYYGKTKMAPKHVRYTCGAAE